MRQGALKLESARKTLFLLESEKGHLASEVSVLPFIEWCAFQLFTIELQERGAQVGRQRPDKTDR